MRGFEKLVVHRGEKLLGETPLEDPTGSVE
jgi:hypothetical protein